MLSGLFLACSVYFATHSYTSLCVVHVSSYVLHKKFRFTAVMMIIIRAVTVDALINALMR